MSNFQKEITIETSATDIENFKTQLYDSAEIYDDPYLYDGLVTSIFTDNKDNLTSFSNVSYNS